MFSHAASKVSSDQLPVHLNLWVSFPLRCHHRQTSVFEDVPWWLEARQPQLDQKELSEKRQLQGSCYVEKCTFKLKMIKQLSTQDQQGDCYCAKCQFNEKLETMIKKTFRTTSVSSSRLCCDMQISWSTQPTIRPDFAPGKHCQWALSQGSSTSHLACHQKQSKWSWTACCFGMEVWCTRAFKMNLLV